MIDFGVAWDKISQFETADELADYFRSEGVKGSCGMPTSCAIAKWMSQVTGENVAVSVNEVWIEDEDLNRFRIVDHTNATVDFVYNFDHSRYPDLIDKDRPGGLTLY